MPLVTHAQIPIDRHIMETLNDIRTNIHTGRNWFCIHPRWNCTTVINFMFLSPTLYRKYIRFYFQNVHRKQCVSCYNDYMKFPEKNIPYSLYQVIRIPNRFYVFYSPIVYLGMHFTIIIVIIVHFHHLYYIFSRCPSYYYFFFN